ncbi:transcription factor E2F4-like, partial [Stegodyphus dumicola]|uniref:transcription factor E2F4-like n=1 Tax=Stegodyphus dumicola TaxID=202533 RepID=UPI0015B2B867
AIPPEVPAEAEVQEPQTSKIEEPPKVVSSLPPEEKKEEPEIPKASSPVRTYSRQTRQASIGVKRTIAAVMSGSRSLQKKRELEASEESASSSTNRMATRHSPRKAPPQPLTNISAPVTRRQKSVSKPDPIDTPQQGNIPTISNSEASCDTADNLLDISKDLLFDPIADDKLQEQILDELISTETLSPFLRLSPPPGARDYFFNLDETEGMCDLFDLSPLF